jgi:hypothetical protein
VVKSSRTFATSRHKHWQGGGCDYEIGRSEQRSNREGSGLLGVLFRSVAPGRLALDGMLRNGILLINVHPLVHIQTEGSIGIDMLIEERC